LHSDKKETGYQYNCTDRNNSTALLYCFNTDFMASSTLAWANDKSEMQSITVDINIFFIHFLRLIRTQVLFRPCSYQVINGDEWLQWQA